MRLPEIDDLLHTRTSGEQRQLLPAPINEARGVERPSAWTGVVQPTHTRALRTEEWYLQCAFFGLESLQMWVEVDPKRRGGVPVLRGTRVTVAEALAEIAESAAIQDVADNFDLGSEQLKEVVNGLSLLMNQPYPR